MKKFIIVVVLFALSATFFTAYAEIYPQTLVVNDINYGQDVLILTDFNGNDWIWVGVEDFCVGDIVAAIMDDNDTKIIFDDTIITLRYAGYMEGWE